MSQPEPPTACPKCCPKCGAKTWDGLFSLYPCGSKWQGMTMKDAVLNQSDRCKLAVAQKTIGEWLPLALFGVYPSENDITQPIGMFLLKSDAEEYAEAIEEDLGCDLVIVEVPCQIKEPKV